MAQQSREMGDGQKMVQQSHFLCVAQYLFSDASALATAANIR
jgi:hypothetical protein